MQHLARLRWELMKDAEKVAAEGCYEKSEQER
jgi:hypothetical protein